MLQSVRGCRPTRLSYGTRLSDEVGREEPTIDMGLGRSAFRLLALLGDIGSPLYSENRGSQQGQTGQHEVSQPQHRADGVPGTRNTRRTRTMLAGSLVRWDETMPSASLIRRTLPRLHVRQEGRKGREHNNAPSEMPFLSRLLALSPRLMSSPRL